MANGFEVDGKCLAYHGPLLYEARILKIYEPTKSTVVVARGKTQTADEANVPQDIRDQSGYFVHYKGWKASWDEWVTDVRVLTYTPENLKLQKDLKAATLRASSAAAGNTGGGAGPVGSAHNPTGKRHSSAMSTSTTASSSSNMENGSKKPRKAVTLESEEEFLRRPEISLSIPDDLKALLVDDWEHITKDNQLVSLPAEITVMRLLGKYSRHKAKPKTDLLEEIIEGLKLYFDRSLPSILLYKFERQQYMDTMSLAKNKTKRPCEIYGPEHLLRLFVSLPGLIAQTSMDQQSVTVLKEFLEDIMKWMAENQDTIFLEHYENTTPAYESANKI